ncbi:MAG: IS3 family transposase [Gemmatimonadota bacterium]
MVSRAETAFQLSQRRACRALDLERTIIRYVSCRPPDTAVRSRLRELAAARPAFGQKRLHVLLRRDGLPINHKKTERLYREEELALKPKQRRRRRAAQAREGRVVVTGPNQRWAMDFMDDTLADGTTIRVFSLVDVATRECVALTAARRFQWADVVALLTAARTARGTLPAVVQCDNGTEFTLVALDHWAFRNTVSLDFSRPGNPVDNCVCEAFNGSVRCECLSQHWFATLAEAQATLITWRTDYNNHRPHTGLGLQPPAEYRRAGIYQLRTGRRNLTLQLDVFTGTRPGIKDITINWRGIAAEDYRTRRMGSRRHGLASAASFMRSLNANIFRSWRVGSCV